ncbi:cytochrome c oxidase subunit 7A2, mitochondrial [Periophthalmus magnuspinnatus]|uniref:cytochrome c oxidase subunit 7A2, mitochondrial n=1 Tax=Periophthalmus magnuspinnatus TaxID=409849 RepID=UPI00145AB263|nr:cytochrome c oxidase subunit 7A2, mitochondrial [Periophthalmus magnuspinnatus]
MNHLRMVPVVLSRGFRSSTQTLKNRVPEAQKHFQMDNGLPVHIKGGTVDVLMYRATMTLTLGGTCYSIYWLLRASVPQKKA